MKKKILICAAVAVFLALSALCIFKLPDMQQKYNKGDEKILAGIENIKIECKGGNVRVLQTERAYFSLEEQRLRKKNSQATLEWLLSGKTLKIRCGSEKECDYIIGVPADTVLDDLDIKGNNINADVSGITVRDLTLRTGSGSVKVSTGKCIDALIAETDSAPVEIEKTFARRMDIETESGNVLIKEPSFQRDCKAETDSGDIKIEALEGSRLNIKESHGKGSFTSAFETDEQGDIIILRTGSGKIDIASSGTSVMPEEPAATQPETASQPETSAAEKTEKPSKAKEETSKKS